MGLAVEVTKPSIDYDEQYDNATVANNATDVTVISLQTKPGKRGFLTVVATTIDAAAQSYVKFKFLKNGTPMFPFASSANQWSDPALNTRLPSRIEIPQLSTIAVVCQVSTSGPASATATARFIIEYEDF